MSGGTHVKAIGARRAAIALAGVAALALAAPCGAVTLHPGDVILAQLNYTNPASILLLDPTTLAPTLLSYGPLVTVPEGVVVDHGGRILVADYYQGIVHVDAGTRGQSVLAGNTLLGGTPTGICLAPDGALFVTVRGSAPGVVRVDANGASVTPVTSGNHISYPGGLALGPDGALYVTEIAIPNDNGGAPFQGHGSIVRVDPASGAQMVVAADSLLIGPFDIAFVGPDEVWTANTGSVAGRHGCFVSTRISDGASAFAQAYSPCRSQGIAVSESGMVYSSDCNTIGPDCYTRYVQRQPDGPILSGYGGHMAVVPSGVTPARRSTWGTLKTIYR